MLVALATTELPQELLLCKPWMFVLVLPQTLSSPLPAPAPLFEWQLMAKRRKEEACFCAHLTHFFPSAKRKEREKKNKSGEGQGLSLSFCRKKRKEKNGGGPKLGDRPFMLIQYL